MCGIVGVAAMGGSAPPTEAQIHRMCQTIVHRGPDDEGIDIRDGVGLGMRRLSIIDVAGGHQPLFNEDGSVRVVFNGEIYNFRELRARLEQAGHRFATRSDTEVLVHGYEEFGSDLPSELNGMFAFAIHDARQRRLLLARDQVGIKPLYFAFVSTGLVWGSEIKVLLASGLVPREIEPDSCAEFLSWEYVPAPNTLFRAVHKLEPGHLLEVDLSQPVREPRPREYWKLTPGEEESPGNETNWSEAIDAQIRESVQRQLVSDVPLGAFLSGGVDSSLVVAGMGPARTFSIGFEDTSYNELPWARKVADFLGVDHRDQVIRPDVVELFDKLMYFMDDPIGDFSIFPTFLVSQLAREEVKVVLTGDGGDEVFGGYDSYVAQQRASFYDALPPAVRRSVIEPLVRALPPQKVKKGLVNKIKRFVEGAGAPRTLGHARWRLFLDVALRRVLFTPEACKQMTRDPFAHVTHAFGEARGYGPVTAGLLVDFRTYLADNILVKADRMSMAISLEARVPLLDRELVELAFRMPDEHKLARGKSKILLKAVAARHVPRDCVYRAKEGFSMPIKNWLGTRFAPLMADLLEPRRLAEQGMFEPSAVQTLQREHLAGKANHSHVLWALMVFQAWRQNWLEEAR